jgi:predicted branched-subunit amino acid permease
MLIGVIPFGLVAGATATEDGFGVGSAVGMSTIVFAGASQLAAFEALASGGSALVAAIAAWTINLRFLLYSASIAPHVAHERLSRRLLMAYLMTDQIYAASVTKWELDDADPWRRLPFYLGGGGLLWVVWQASTIAGAVGGAAVPEDVPLDFAVPLVFLVLLVPALLNRAAVVAALAGGIGAVVAAEAGAGALSIVAGAVTGIVAGAIAEGATG